MPFTPGESNVRLEAGNGVVGAGVVAALGRLDRRGQRLRLRGHCVPDAELPLVGGHLQGVGLAAGRAILTTSADDGHILGAQRTGTPYIVDGVRKTNGTHPGGLQIIGNFVAVPVWTDSASEVHFFAIGPDLTHLGHATIQLPERSGCVGITDYADTDGDCYIVAASTAPDELRFYKSTPNTPLSDTSCRFTHLRTWDQGMADDAARATWRPDKVWGDYPNSMGLLADDDNNLYYVGLHKAGLLVFDWWGRDYIDLFRVDLKAQDDRMITKLANVHAKCRSGTSFRWGGGVRTTSSTTFQVYACERNVRGKHVDRARLNVFRAPNDTVLAF